MLLKVNFKDVIYSALKLWQNIIKEAWLNFQQILN